MYTKTEKKELRIEFWNRFKGYSGRKRRRLRLPSKWAGDNTGIKGLVLKFHFDENEALVCIDITTGNLDKRISLFDKLESLKKIFEETAGNDLVWDLQYITETGTEISRVYFQMSGVNIYDKKCWPDVMVFFYNKMIRIEPVIIEYRDFIMA